jgi:uncharacterized repeat protein (TIGR01451 family)
VPDGGELTYDLEVANAGPDPATSAAVALTLPAGVTLVDGDGTGGPCTVSAANPQVVGCPLGDLGRGASGQATVRVHVDVPAGSSLTTTALAASTTLDQHDADNRAEAVTTVTADTPE